MRLSKDCLVAASLLAVLCLAGCDTEDELAQQRLKSLAAQANGLDALKKDLTSQPKGMHGFEGPGVVSLFLSKNLINSALKGAAGSSLPLPNIQGGILTIKAITADLKVGYPLVTIEAEATKKDIGLTLSVVGTARLETTLDSGESPQLTIAVRLEDLVPKAHWGPFDFKVGGFVRDVMKAKASEALSNIASLKFAMGTDLPLAMPAANMPVNFPGVNTPALNITGHAALSRILFLPDGLHAYGTLTAKVGT
jgi:hypothetical protein